MRNITPGFRDWKNIPVHAMSVVDGVRFMLTSDGIDVMYEKADVYLVPSDDGLFAYELTDDDLSVRGLDRSERREVRNYCREAYRMGFMDREWYEASRRL